MAREFGAQILIEAENLTDPSFERVSKSLRQIETAIKQVNAVGARLQATGKNIRGIGQNIIVANAAAAISLGVVTKVGSDFEEQFGRISTLLDTDAQGALNRFGDNVKDIGLLTGKSFTGINDALFENISALGANAETTDFLALSAKTAVGAFTDVKTVIDGTTSVLNAYGLELGLANEIQGAFFLANKRGKTTLDEIAQSIGLVAPIARVVGVDFKNLTAAVTATTLGGLSTAQSFLGLRQAFVNIQKPSEQAIKIITRINEVLPKQFKLEFSGEGLKRLGLQEFLTRLGGIAEARPADFARLFESTEARTSILTLLSQMKTFNTTLAETQDITLLTTLVQDNFNKNNKSVALGLRRAFRSIQLVGIELFFIMRPALIAVINLFTKVVSTVAIFIRENKVLGRILGVIAALFVVANIALGLFLIAFGTLISFAGSAILIGLSAVISFFAVKLFSLVPILLRILPGFSLLVKIFGLIKTGLLALFSPIAFVIAKFVLLAALFAALLAPIVAFISGFISGFLDGIAPVVDFVRNKILGFFSDVKQVVVIVSNIVTKFWVGVWEKITTVTGTAIQKVKDFFKLIFELGRRLGFGLGEKLSGLFGFEVEAKVTAAESPAVEQAQENAKKVVKVNQSTQSKISEILKKALAGRNDLLKDASKKARKIEFINLFAGNIAGERLTGQFIQQRPTGVEQGFATRELQAAMLQRPSETSRSIRIDRVELPNVQNAEDFINELEKLSTQAGT